MELSWQTEPHGELGVRRHFESPYRPGQKITIDEYYRYIFERVPGLPEAAAAKNLDALAYMRRFGAFMVKDSTYATHERRLRDEERQGAVTDPASGLVLRDGRALGVAVADAAV